MTNSNSSSVARLSYLGQTFIPSVSKEFIVADNLIINTSPEAKIKIKYIGDHIEYYFWGKIEGPVAEMASNMFELEVESFDKDILAPLGDIPEIHVGQIFALLELQGIGEPGVLSTEISNLFYVRDRFGKMWVFVAYWDIDGWDLNAQPLPHKYPWPAGPVIFLPEGSDNIPAA